MPRSPEATPSAASITRQHTAYSGHFVKCGAVSTRRNCPAGATFSQPCLGESVVSYHLTLDVFCADFWSSEGWDDDALCDAAERCGRSAAHTCEVIAIGSCDALDDADVAQAAQ